MIHENVKIVAETAVEVAKALTAQTGDSYVAECHPEHWGADIVGPDGVRLFCADAERYGGKAERVEIMGSYPTGYLNKVGRAEDFAIKVRRDRGVETIAKEIVRRLLPGYLPELARVVERIASHDKGKSDQQATAERLAAMFGETVRDGEFQPRIGNGYGTVRVLTGGDKVSLDLNYIDVDMAERMLKAALDV
jgi:hypothetical protein